MSRVILLSLGASLVFAAPATASEEHLQQIDALCAVALNLPPEGCACIREKATQLTDDQQAYGIAMAKRDTESMAELGAALSDEQAKQVKKLILEAPRVCKNPS